MAITKIATIQMDKLRNLLGIKKFKYFPDISKYLMNATNKVRNNAIIAHKGALKDNHIDSISIIIQLIHHFIINYLILFKIFVIKVNLNLL